MENSNSRALAPTEQQVLEHKRKVKVLLAKMDERIEEVLPKVVPKKRFLGVMLSLANTPELLKCNPQNIVRCALRMAMIGLDPDPAFGLIYPVRYGDDLKPIIGYRGIIELATRSDSVKAVHADVVYLKHDNFRYSKGVTLELVHEPNLTKDLSEEEPDLAYSVAELTSGATIAVVLRKWEIEQRKDRSQAAQNAKKYNKTSPWDTDRNAMWRKSAVRALEPWLPKATELRRALALDADATPEEAKAAVIDAEFSEIDENENGNGNGDAPTGPHAPAGFALSDFTEDELKELQAALKKNRAQVQYFLSRFEGSKEDVLKLIGGGNV